MGKSLEAGETIGVCRCHPLLFLLGSGERDPPLESSQGLGCLVILRRTLLEADELRAQGGPVEVSSGHW